jgi:hypothetical protein
MRADTGGDKEGGHDRAPPPSSCRCGAETKRIKKKQEAAAPPITSGAPRKSARPGTGRAREPGPPTNAVDPTIITIAAVGAATWTYQQPVGDHARLFKFVIVLRLINRHRHQDLQL